MSPNACLACTLTVELFNVVSRRGRDGPQGLHQPPLLQPPHPIPFAGHGHHGPFAKQAGPPPAVHFQPAPLVGHVVQPAPLVGPPAVKAGANGGHPAAKGGKGKGAKAKVPKKAQGKGGAAHKKGAALAKKGG